MAKKVKLAEKVKLKAIAEAENAKKEYLGLVGAEKKVEEKKAGKVKQDDQNAKKEVKKEAKEEPKDEIPMDAAAIKAYSSVIADAAEDSEPQTPVQYSAVIPDEEKKAPQSLSQDPMGSMIQNEISEIKDASIKASKENEWKSNEC